MRVFSSSKKRFYCHFHSDGIYLSTTRADMIVTNYLNCKLAFEHEIFSQVHLIFEDFYFKFTVQVQWEVLNLKSIKKIHQT